MRVAAFAVLLLWALPAAALTRATNLTALPTRIEVGVDGPVTARVLALATPLRLVIDLGGVDAARQEVTGSGAVKAARIGQFDVKTARIVVDLAKPMRVVAADVGDDGRLTIKLAPASATEFATATKRGRVSLVVGARSVPPVPDLSKPTPAKPTKPTAAAKPATSSPLATKPAANASADPAPPADTGAFGKPAADPDFDLPDGTFGPKVKPPATSRPIIAGAVLPPTAPRSGGKKPLVVIDAGHGGKDVGAIALDGRYEKDVTLAIARVVAKSLNASGKVRAKLTREDDRFIPLGGRVAIARTARADLFISIHADSAPNPLARGASAYTLSDTASDAVAARLAARENKADIIGGVNLGVEAPEVGDIMIALMRRSTLNSAIAFAEALQDALGDRVVFRGEFHHFAGFLVLKAADVPSVLLETGYVSNADDADFLFSKKGQKIVGEGVAKAIEKQLTGR
ncbi:N-acetylmuramoyl-L-alanine amidase [Sphingosinicellaceae bacterium]|nr:N-acetylmuramoyl-L-alanine amidase [Sphingosinicellaceae bacterium]